MTPTASDRVRSARAAAALRLADLEGELAAIGESTAATPDDEHDAEGSTVGFERARVGALADETRRALAALDAALARLADGSYGRCSTCGGAIAPERLDALPSTTRCVTCSAAGNTAAPGTLAPS